MWLSTQSESQRFSVSVVIPAFKAASTIERALKSVFSQTVRPEQIIVVDDGSPDEVELRNAIKPYEADVTLLRKTNGGAASARNFGIEHATGDWIAFLDADDYWESDKLSRQKEIALRYPEVSVIGCLWYLEYPGCERTPDPRKTIDFAGRELSLSGAGAFDVAMNIWTTSLVIRRSALSGLAFEVGLEPAEDRDLWFRLLSSQKAYIVPEFLATYVQEPGGISRNNIDRDCTSMLAVIRRCEPLIGTTAAKTQRATVYRRGASVHLSMGRPMAALRYALVRLSYQPLSLQGVWIVVKSAFLGAKEIFSIKNFSEFFGSAKSTR